MRNRGITLVALVITVIVLIILAGITISVILGEGGLIDKTKQGVANYKDQATRETIQIAITTAMANKEAKINKDVLIQQLNEQIGEGKYTLNTNDATGEITITVGEIEYKVSSNGTVSGGSGNNNNSQTNQIPEGSITFNDNNFIFNQNFKVDKFCNGDIEQLDADYNNGEVIFDFTDKTDASYMAISSEKIDLSNCNMIGVEYEVTKNIYGAGIGIYNNNYIKDFYIDNDDSENYVTDIKFSSDVGTHFTCLDVSSYSGNYVIAVTSWKGGRDTEGTIKIKDIVLLKESSIPAMTADTTTVNGYGTLIATSSQLQDEKSKPYRAFDHLTNSSDVMEVWHSSTSTPQWIQLQFPNKTKISEFAIVNRNWAGEDNVSKFILYGSDNATDWTQLTNECINPTTSRAITFFKVNNPGEYLYYKWDITRTSTGYAVIDEIVLTERIKK